MPWLFRVICFLINSSSVGKVLLVFSLWLAGRNVLRFRLFHYSKSGIFHQVGAAIRPWWSALYNLTGLISQGQTLCLNIKHSHFTWCIWVIKTHRLLIALGMRIMVLASRCNVFIAILIVKVPLRQLALTWPKNIRKVCFIVIFYDKTCFPNWRKQFGLHVCVCACVRVVQ